MNITSKMFALDSVALQITLENQSEISEARYARVKLESRARSNHV